MYGWLWRHLPGGRAMRTAQAVVLFAAAVTLLMLVVFPALEPHLPFGQDTIHR